MGGHGTRVNGDPGEETAWGRGANVGCSSSSGAIFDTMLLLFFPALSLPDILMGHESWVTGYGSWVIPVLLQSQNSASASKFSVYLPLPLPGPPTSVMAGSWLCTRGCVF